jgi:hypothetical protein
MNKPAHVLFRIASLKRTELLITQDEAKPTLPVIQTEVFIGRRVIWFMITLIQAIIASIAAAYCTR